MLYDVIAQAAEFSKAHGLKIVRNEQAFAVTSLSDKFRYLLGRIWDVNGVLWHWHCANPSIARINDDATVRKIRGFSVHGGAGGFVLTNTLPYSETDPKKLLGIMVKDGPSGVSMPFMNSYAIRFAGLDLAPSAFIAAWGAMHPEVRKLAQSGIDDFVRWSRPSGIRCLGKTKDGSPRHPLRLGYDTKLELWG